MSGGCQNSLPPRGLAECLLGAVVGACRCPPSAEAGSVWSGVEHWGWRWQKGAWWRGLRGRAGAAACVPASQTPVGSLTSTADTRASFPGPGALGTRAIAAVWSRRLRSLPSVTVGEHQEEGVHPRGVREMSLHTAPGVGPAGLAPFSCPLLNTVPPTRAEGKQEAWPGAAVCRCHARVFGEPGQPEADLTGQDAVLLRESVE